MKRWEAFKYRQKLWHSTAPHVVVILLWNTCFNRAHLPRKEKAVRLPSHAAEDFASLWRARRISAGEMRSFGRPMQVLSLVQLAWAKARKVLPVLLKISHVNCFFLLPYAISWDQRKTWEKNFGLACKRGDREIPGVGALWLRSHCFSVTSFKHLLFLILHI